MIRKISGILVGLANRSLWLTGLVVIVAGAGLLTGIYVTQARAPDQEFPGTTAPGSHEWWAIHGTGDANTYNNFCYRCHNQIYQEVSATAAANTHPINLTCLSCHGRDNLWNFLGDYPGSPPEPDVSGIHVATRAKCAYCHEDKALQLANENEAHGHFIADLGETMETASWACKSCHTKVSVNMTTEIRPALELMLDAH